MNYDSFASTFSRSRKNLSWPELDAIIADMIAHGSTHILDIGCGNGRFIEQSLGSWLSMKRYYGIDSSSWMIDEARKLYPSDEFYRFDVIPMQSLRYEWFTQYSSILLLASFHHLETEEERIQVLQNIRWFLRPHGRIYMTNWNLRDQPKYDTMNKSDGEYNIKIWEYSRYYHGFTLDELATLFREVGFEIEEHRVFEGGRNFLSILSLPA